MFTFLSSFIPIICGLILEITFLGPDTLTVSDINERHLASLWIELIVASYLLPVGVNFTTHFYTKLAYVGPALALVFCIFFAMLLPKIGINSEWNTIWIPDGIAILSLSLNAVITNIKLPANKRGEKRTI